MPRSLLRGSLLKDLFALHQENAWNLDVDALIAFFRANDGTSAIVGKRQALTFQLLAAFSGHGDVPEPKSTGSKGVPTKKTPAKTSRTAGNKASKPTTTPPSEPPAVGLSVKIEVNLPADGDQATYDRIFKSIRENLLNG